MNRTDQLEKFGRLLSLAGSLNRGSNVADKIKELEILAGELTRHDLGTSVRASFARWVADKVTDTNVTEQPVAWYHEDSGTVELSRCCRVGWHPLYPAKVNEEKPLTSSGWSDKKPDSVGWWWEWTGNIADAPEVVCVVSVDPLRGYYRNQKGHQILDGGPFYSGPIPQPKSVDAPPQEHS
jgi:hypothetical protein